MAGRPIVRAAIARMEAYGLERMLEHIADGWPVRRIGELAEIQSSRPVVTGWLNGKIGSESPGSEAGREARLQRRAAYHLAKVASADSLVEDAGEILDSETDGRNAALAKARSDFRLWLASRRNREAYDTKQAPGLVINVGSLHLDALRRLSSATRAASALPALIAEDGSDYELVAPGDELVAPGDQLAAPGEVEESDR